MEVIVEDKQLSLAIGKKGQNVRLAAKLTGWRIDIKSEEEKRREIEAQLEGLAIGTRQPRPPRAKRRGQQRANPLKTSRQPPPRTRLPRARPPRTPRRSRSMPRPRRKHPNPKPGKVRTLVGMVPSASNGNASR